MDAESKVTSAPRLPRLAFISNYQGQSDYQVLDGEMQGIASVCATVQRLRRSSTPPIEHPQGRLRAACSQAPSCVRMTCGVLWRWRCSRQFGQSTQSIARCWYRSGSTHRVWPRASIERSGRPMRVGAAYRTMALQRLVRPATSRGSGRDRFRPKGQARSDRLVQRCRDLCATTGDAGGVRGQRVAVRRAERGRNATDPAAVRPAQLHSVGSLSGAVAGSTSVYFDTFVFVALPSGEAYEYRRQFDHSLGRGLRWEEPEHWAGARIRSASSTRKRQLSSTKSVASPRSRPASWGWVRRCSGVRFPRLQSGPRGPQ
jgi:hypothetical protein